MCNTYQEVCVFTSVSVCRDDAAAARDRLQGKLESAQLALLRQKEQCDRAKLRSKKLLLSNQQLTNSLLLERIIK